MVVVVATSGLTPESVGSIPTSSTNEGFKGPGPNTPAITAGVIFPDRTVNVCIYWLYMLKIARLGANMEPSPAVIRQQGVVLDLSIIGVDDWRTCLGNDIELRSTVWQNLCGAETVAPSVYLTKLAEMNGTTPEREIVNHFLNLGYTLEEMVVEFVVDECLGWGRCTWYKEHPSYPLAFEPDSFAARHGKIVPNLFKALFATEHAGDQRKGFYSAEMLTKHGILAYKMIVFHKIVFSAPVAP